MPTITILSAKSAPIRIDAPTGSNLRRVLLANHISPYAKFTRRLNCGGRGICATCGIWVLEGNQAPEHWHDWLANQFDYPRLSCQITVDHDLTIHLVDDKWIWGRRGNPHTNPQLPD